MDQVSSAIPEHKRKPRKSRAQKRAEAMQHAMEQVLPGAHVVVVQPPSVSPPTSEPVTEPAAASSTDPHRPWWMDKWDPEIKCSICLGRLRPGRIHTLAGIPQLKTHPCYKLPCGHKFHLVCVRQIAKAYYPRCPLCRAPFAQHLI